MNPIFIDFGFIQIYWYSVLLFIAFFSLVTYYNNRNLQLFSELEEFCNGGE